MSQKEDWEKEAVKRSFHIALARVEDMVDNLEPVLKKELVDNIRSLVDEYESFIRVFND